MRRVVRISIVSIASIAVVACSFWSGYTVGWVHGGDKGINLGFRLATMHLNASAKHDAVRWAVDNGILDYEEVR